MSQEGRVRKGQGQAFDPLSKSRDGMLFPFFIVDFPTLKS